MNSFKICEFKLHQGGVNQNVFGDFLKSLFQTLSEKNEKYILVMDNVAFHKTTDIKILIENSGHKLLLLPPYSPFLNPIEEVFNQLKSYVKRKSPKSHEELIKYIEESPSVITTENCQNYIKHSKSYFSACLNKNIINN